MAESNHGGVPHGERARTEIARLRRASDSGITQPLAWRRRQLRALRRLLTERSAELEEAVAVDLGKAASEFRLTESGVVIAEIDYALRHLRRWARARRVRVPLAIAPARAKTLPEPLGVVLIIGPWNYPVQLVLGPLVAALAAGNAAIVKPSELAPATSAALARLVPRYLDRRAVAVVEGGVDVTTALLAEPVDHILYTGNGTVGRIVARAAAEHLTPITLELGGKSPVFVDNTVDLRDAALRIAWGKFMNAGQTCVSPDYVLATPDVAERLSGHLAEAITRLYGSDPRHSPDYGRIVNERHVERLAALLDGVEPSAGGQIDRAERYIAPTIVDGADPDGALMADEIFGPILPIVHTTGVDDAIRFIRARPAPLALYLFTGNAAATRRFLRHTRSGAVGIGVPSVHLLVPGLPFGGVGASGMGAYHGRFGFETFSHRKAVLRKPMRPETLGLVTPPFTAARVRAVNVIARMGRRRAPAPPHAPDTITETP